jgi:hypothetical protein
MNAQQWPLATFFGITIVFTWALDERVVNAVSEGLAALAAGAFVWGKPHGRSTGGSW